MIADTFSGIPCQAIILAGGSGTRLWPYSRTLLPKQLLALTTKATMLQQTAQRTLALFPPENIWIVTTQEQIFEVRSQLADLDPALAQQVLVEPLKRNTLPASLLGIDQIIQRDPEAVVAVFPSDHLIHKPQKWHKAMQQGVRLAHEGWFVTFGVRPDKPETGYGYIERGTQLSSQCFVATAFIEKPSLKKAREFFQQENYLWNSGMFVFSSTAFLDALSTLQPALTSYWNRRDQEPLQTEYAHFPDISLDYGIMEQVKRQAVIEIDFGWDDVGSWEALYRLGEKDTKGNVTQGDVLALDCTDSLLLSQGGKLAAVGVEGLCVVQTRDATLVCPARDTQRVREVVSALKEEGSPLVQAHVTVYRPWGSYTVLEEGTFYKIKRITILPGASLSLQKHQHRSEHWVVISGTALVRVGEQEMLLSENHSVDIPKTTLHRLGNPGTVPVEIIEIQTGSYLEEDDIVRFDDIYGRVQN